MMASKFCLRSTARAFMSPRVSTAKPGLGRTLATAAEAGAADGDVVNVHYTGTLDDGSVFDTSRQEGREPLEFTVGNGQVIKGFDMAVTGLQVGESNKVRCEAGDAYGEWTEEMVIKVPKEEAPPNVEKDMMVQLSNGMPARIADVSDNVVSVDANHRLAGKALTFEVELMALTKA